MTMVSRFTIPALAALAVLTANPVVHAADMPMPVPIAVPEAAGWYLRGDIGFSNQNVGSLFNENYTGYDSVQNIYKSFDAAPFFGLGVGYYFNNWLRFDVTGEYRGNANFHGYDLGTFGGVPYPDLYNGNKSEWTFLLNGYVDLGTWSNLTPFVGAGIGTSRNTVSNFTDVSNCVGGCGNPGANYYSATASQWNFAWALYAGFGYQLTRNVTVELVYRYLDLGKASTGTMVSFDGLFTSTPFEFNHLTSQDLKLGLRFDLNSVYEVPHPIPYYSPPPLNSKG
jgi:opacity protein-like surface antigen